jgi:hypothetical protein
MAAPQQCLFIFGNAMALRRAGRPIAALCFRLQDTMFLQSEAFHEAALKALGKPLHI